MLHLTLNILHLIYSLSGLRYEAEHHDNQLYIVTNKGTYFLYFYCLSYTVMIIMKSLFNDDCYYVIIIMDTYLILFTLHIFYLFHYLVCSIIHHMTYLRTIAILFYFSLFYFILFYFIEFQFSCCPCVISC